MDKCPICGGEEFIPQGSCYVCSTCGYGITLSGNTTDETDKNQSTNDRVIGQLISDGINKLECGNYDNAYQFFHAAYDLEPKSIAALLGMLAVYEGCAGSIAYIKEHGVGHIDNIENRPTYIHELGDIYRSHSFIATNEVKYIINTANLGRSSNLFMSLAIGNHRLMPDNDVIRLLIECGADIGHKNKRNETALDAIYRIYEGKINKYPVIKERIAILKEASANTNNKQDNAKQVRIAQLNAEKGKLQEELQHVKGLFAESKRKKVETRLAEIDAELAKLD